MTLSTVRDGETLVVDLVSDALRKIFVLEGTETPESADIDLGVKTLRRMLRSWAAHGVRLWLEDEQIITLAADTATYTLSPRTLSVDDAFRRTGDTDTPIKLMTREEYKRLPNKSVSGAPFAAYVERLRTETKVTVYPVPASAGDFLHLDGKRQIFDPTGSTQEIEIPPEWEECVVYNLAVRLAPDFGAQLGPDVSAMALELYEMMTGQDREGSVYMRARAR